MDPLEGLDDVPWGQLTHAFGSAEDVPGLLRQLEGGPEERRDAMYELQGNIWHQGTIYEATAHAVPFLARLAESDPSLAPELLFFLGEIADGDGPANAREAVRAELRPMIALLQANLARPVLAGFCRLAYAFPEEQQELREPLYDAFHSNVGTPLEQAAIAMALLRAGDDTWGGVVMVDVLSAALEPGA